MAALPTVGLLDELVRQVVVLQEAMNMVEHHAQLGDHDEVEQHVLEGLVATRRIVREINMSVLPKVEHVRDALRQVRRACCSTRS